MIEDQTSGAVPDCAGWSGTDAILRNLLQAGNLERLETEAKRILALDPEETTAHYYLALAAKCTNGSLFLKLRMAPTLHWPGYGPGSGFVAGRAGSALVCLLPPI